MTFLQIGEDRTIVEFAKKQTIYAQGAACSAFFILDGKVKLTVLSPHGKEATIAILVRAISSGKFALQDSRSAWELQPR
jgi:CRP-like cAMP-binding protein